MNINEQPIALEAPEGSANRRQADTSKIKKLINWEPVITLEQGLQLTVENLCK